MIIEGECSLITERLSLLKPNYLRLYLIQIIENIGCLSVTDDNTDVLLRVCSDYKNKQHMSCNESCNEQSIESLLLSLNLCYFYSELFEFYVSYFSVPWQKCPMLVSSRKISLVKGMAIVPCNQWNSLLVDLFRLIYIKSLHRIQRSMSALDENNLQIEYLNDRINNYYCSKIDFWRNTGEEISLEELYIEKQLLPPCMILSLNSLFTNHRLAHYPRYRLTLFLKDIGVSLDQTLKLFKQEYSKSGNLGSTCMHNWEQHYKQIEYNVRHTYGILGSKKNYQMTSCAYMQVSYVESYKINCVSI